MADVVTKISRSTEMLRELNVKLIFWVDDDFAVTDKKVTTLLRALPGKEAECSGVIGLSIDEAGFWEADLPEHWRRIPALERWSIYHRLLDVDPDRKGELHEQLFPNQLKRLLSGVEVKGFPPSLWDDVVKHEIEKALHTAPADGLIWCLFDQMLDNDDKSDYREGTHLLQTALSEIKADQVLFGLYSKVFDGGNELTKGKEEAEKHGVPFHRFMAIAKQRGKSDEAFAEGIRLTSLMLACRRVTSEVAAATIDATNEAQAELQKLSVIDFYHFISRTSHSEGTWDVDTLLRMFQIYYSIHLRRFVYARRNQLNRLTQYIRARIRAKGPEANADQQGVAWKHGKAEDYEVSENINPYYLPLELGDIFYVEGDGHYILLGQPCDLAIRKNGNRSAKFGHLVRISATQPQKNQEKATFELRFFGPLGEPAWVYFKDAYPVSLDILDLAAFNSSGDCLIDVAEKHALDLHGPWQKRLDSVTELYLDISRRLPSLLESLTDEQTDIRSKLLTAMVPFASVPNLSIEYLNDQFKFSLRRVYRFRLPKVAVLLQQFAAYNSRPALDPDFFDPTNSGEFKTPLLRIPIPKGFGATLRKRSS